MRLNDALYRCSNRKCKHRWRRPISNIPPICPACGSLYLRWLNSRLPVFEAQVGETDWSIGPE